jgi:hypothetical protein
MLKKLIGSTIMVLLFIVVVNAQSQQPTPSSRILGSHEKSQTAKKKDNPQNDQRGTEQSPIVVKVAPSPNAQDEAAQAKKEKQNQAAANRRAELITIIIAFATAVQAIALIITIIVMLRTTRRQLRAYVFVNDISIFNVANPLHPLAKDYKKTGAEISRPNDGPIIAMTIKNSGQTPAYEVVNEGHMCIQEFPLISNLPTEPPSKFITKTAIPPGGITTKNLTMRPLTKEEIAQLRNGTMAIYVYGKIIYKDTFGKISFTNFRVMHFAAAQIIGIGTGMTICDEGNEAN